MKTYSDTELLNALLANGWIVEPVADYWDGKNWVKNGFSCEGAPCGYLEGGGNCPTLGFGLTQREAIADALNKGAS